MEFVSLAINLVGCADMRMADPIPTFTYLITRIAELYPNFAFIHVVEPRISGNLDREVKVGEVGYF